MRTGASRSSVSSRYRFRRWPASLTRRWRGILPVAGTMVACSLVFFLLSNGAVWAFSGMYPLTGQGLTQCYIAALPFLDKTVLGDLFWTAVLFGGAWLVQHMPSLSRRAL